MEHLQSDKSKGFALKAMLKNYKPARDYEKLGAKIGRTTNMKQKAYGDSIRKSEKLLRVFLEDYETLNDAGEKAYLIPDELLRHLLLQVRVIDKQNRIFSNPKGDLMEENPYRDIAGYGILGANEDVEDEACKQCHYFNAYSERGRFKENCAEFVSSSNSCPFIENFNKIK